MDSLKCQTPTLAPAEPGGFLTLLTDVHPFASDRDLICIRFHPQAPDVPSKAYAGTRTPSFAPFRSDFTVYIRRNPYGD
jgi:hypothetical protein